MIRTLNPPENTENSKEELKKARKDLEMEKVETPQHKRKRENY